MKKIAAFLLLLIGVGAIVLYFQPSDPLTSSEDLYIHQMKDEYLEVIPKSLNKEENNGTEITTTLLNQSEQSNEEAQFYNTKSDPAIQPIDPEKDPANEIKTL
ncbi:hypothetical protein EXE30_01575 [Acinetobacter halotolerans]|uniref:Uncharacterized protein n=1 Tax=Acinetobacter halotolerans TaxID=1752076 RepID=A0A4Q6XE75_9GAMM|nr:hypothetical protein [Acinetobacter halotolerans]RZF56971.1 hypothetical protein EXE30_01575 [Acinetobacter halotolerans]